MSDFHTSTARVAVLAQIGAAASKPRLVADAIMTDLNMADMAVSDLKGLLNTRGTIIALVRQWAGEYKVERNGTKTHAETGAELVTRTLRNRLNKMVKDGEQTDGEQTDGEQTDGEQTDGEQTEAPITLTMGDVTVTVTPADGADLYSNLRSIIAAQVA